MSNSGTAEPQLGPTHRGWYSRGYLPHCDHPGLLQSITYHLADSLPAAILEQIDAELRTLPPERQDSERRRRVEAWLDAGHGSCVLRLPEAAACVVDTWRHFAGERYDLIAWVVMPNHVHVLVRVYEGVPIAKIVQSWKSYTGRRIRTMMEEESRAGARRSQGEGIWMREYWDRYIRDERHFQMAVDYIHQNPVKAGLVRMAKDWPWSSARESAELGLGDPGAGDSGDAEHELGRPGEQEPADGQQSCLKERESMIARVWHGVTAEDKAEEFLGYVKRTGVPGLSSTPGNLGVMVFRRVEQGKVHFLLTSFWESRDAIARFAGPNIEQARYYPEDEKYLLELEPTVTHYEVAVGQEIIE